VPAYLATESNVRRPTSSPVTSSKLFISSVREDTVLPLYQPIKSIAGEMLSEIAIPKGTTLIMSLLAANHNKDLWGEDASEWRPERWLNATGERVQLNADSEVGGETKFCVTSEKTPGVKGGMKYPGVYASM